MQGNRTENAKHGPPLHAQAVGESTVVPPSPVVTVAAAWTGTAFFLLAIGRFEKCWVSGFFMFFSNLLLC